MKHRELPAPVEESLQAEKADDTSEKIITEEESDGFNTADIRTGLATRSFSAEDSEDLAARLDKLCKEILELSKKQNQVSETIADKRNFTASIKNMISKYFDTDGKLLEGFDDMTPEEQRTRLFNILAHIYEFLQHYPLTEEDLSNKEIVKIVHTNSPAGCLLRTLNRLKSSNRHYPSVTEEVSKAAANRELMEDIKTNPAKYTEEYHLRGQFEDKIAIMLQETFEFPEEMFTNLTPEKKKEKLKNIVGNILKKSGIVLREEYLSNEINNRGGIANIKIKKPLLGDLCYILKYLVGQDTPETFQKLKDISKEAKKLRENNDEQFNKLRLSIKANPNEFLKPFYFMEDYILFSAKDILTEEFGIKLSEKFADYDKDKRKEIIGYILMKILEQSDPVKAQQCNDSMEVSGTDFYTKVANNGPSVIRCLCVLIRLIRVLQKEEHVRTPEKRPQQLKEAIQKTLKGEDSKIKTDLEKLLKDIKAHPEKFLPAELLNPGT